MKEKAAYFCDGEKCFCNYDCGVEKKYASPKYGKDKHCPLEKYNMPADRNMKSQIKWEREYPSTDEILDIAYTLCSNCEFIYARNGEGTYEDFETHCVDCAVYMTEEALSQLPTA